MSARSIGLTGWCVIAATAVTLGVLGQRARGRIPPPGAVMTAIVRARFGRVGLLVGWIALGWHLFLAPPGG